MNNWDKDKVLDMADNRIITYSNATLCDNYRLPLERCKTPAQAIRLYKNCISWALQERYPTKDDLLGFTDKQTLADNGVFIDTHFNGEIINDHICCVFINCTGKISTCLNLSKKIIPMFYLSEGSDLKIDILDESHIPIELYYGSKVSVNKRKQVTIRNYNKLSAKDNIGFTEQQLSVNPNMDNEYL